MSILVRHAARGARRIVVGGLAGLCAGLLLAACQGSFTTPKADRPPDEQQPAQEDEREGPVLPDVPAPSDGAVKAAPTIRLLPAALNVREGESATYAVVLGTDPEGAVTVTMQAAGDLTVRPTGVSFTSADWDRPREVTVSAARDADVVVDAPVRIGHAARGGGYDGVTAAVTVTIVEVDVATVAVAGADAAEHDAALQFEVTVSRASAGAVTVRYATGGSGDTAQEGQDYARTHDTLRIPAGSMADTIEVALHDDALDEADEVLTLTLSNANAPLAGGGATVAVTGTILDDDELPRLSIHDGQAVEGAGDGTMLFAVTMQPVSGRVVLVDYATGQGSATAEQDYTGARGTLTFAVGSTERTVAVAIVDDHEVEAEETFTVALSNPRHADVSAASATGTITSDDFDTPLRLTSLEVTGAGTMYPAFDQDTFHYAMTCADSAALEVTAKRNRNTARLTLLRADKAQQHTVNADLDKVALTADEDDDVAVELIDVDGTETYVVHCLPSEFPDIVVLQKSAGVSDGLLLGTPRYDQNGVIRFTAVMDNNGVPRFHRRGGFHIRYYDDGPTVFGRQVRYSVGQTSRAIALWDGDFKAIRILRGIPSGAKIDTHDFLVTPGGDYLFNGRERNARDLSGRTDLLDSNGQPFGTVSLFDSVLEVTSPGGGGKFYWNSWNHLHIPDCRLREFPGQYAHLNAFQLVDGDIVASLRGCAQVVRIDGTTGDIEWKLGGSDDTEGTDTEYLGITVGDGDEREPEFCGQHHVTLTDWDSVVMFDNGVFCGGARKAKPVFSRAVSYDISSGTNAVLEHEVKQPDGHGYSDIAGSVSVLREDRWLVAWGRPKQVNASDHDAYASIVEVDPATGTTYLRIHMSKSGKLAWSYRVYRVPESAIQIPLELP